VIRALLVDWGDTLMRVFPNEVGPMARWSRVEAIPGAREALRALHETYLIALATNGGAAGAPLVRAALARVGLDDCLHEVFTAADLGARKPDPAFFLAALRRLSVDPREAAMVGDSYAEDVVGAKRAGLFALWWNERGASCPDPHPLYDAELLRMSSLPALLAAPFLPDVAACLALLAEQGAPPQLVAHSQAVAEVAFRLAARLRDRGEAVDPLLAHRGGLLHDLDKVSAKEPTRPHGEWSGTILRERGFPQLAAIARRHVVFAILDPRTRPVTWEERIVFYADKVVEGETVVGVRERIAALIQRYPGAALKLASCLPLVLTLEEEIASGLGTPPSQLLARVR
jgi:HAD superfamily hydrolase (TIGR01509 family)